MISKSTLNTEKIGTLEFCTALNGDDPVKAISFLKRFVKTIRREKVEALSSNVISFDDDVLEESDEEFPSAELLEPPAKKAKVEAWKLDTKSYNVPFVGTSTYKGPCGVVRKGAWPTGFLEAYLKQSPKAIEILGSGGKSKDDFPLVPPHGLLHQTLQSRKDNSGKLMSTKIFELYIQAIGEIATCGIQLATMRSDVNGSIGREENKDGMNNSDLITAKLEKNVEDKASYEHIISTIMKDHLPVLLNVLNNEYTNSGKQSYMMTESVLNALSNLALTSIGAAREIVRELDNVLKEGVLQRLVARSFSFGNTKRLKDGNSDEILCRLRMLEAFLRLASVLIGSGDNYALSYSISQGVKESKTKPGIAYILIRRIPSVHSIRMSLNTEKISRTRVFSRLKRFYQSIRSNVLTSNTEQETGGRLPLNTVIAFLHGDVLETITKNMLLSTQNNECGDEVDSVRKECQDLMIILLVDRSRSPFLKHIHSEKSSDTIISSCSGIMIRCIQIILSCSSDAMVTRDFILRCFEKSPVLLSRYFRVVQAPEPTPSFQTISFYSLLTFFIENGPTKWDSDSDRLKDLSTDKAIIQILPKSLTKNVLTKTLQSSNALLIVECLKIIDATLKRFRHFLKVLGKTEENLVENCTKTLFRRLPDLQVFLSVRAKFDPFQHKKMEKLAMIVTISICDLIRNYTSLFLSTLSTLQFDWVKLLPDKVESFCSASINLQSRLLITLQGILKSYQVIGSYSNTLTSSTAFRTFASIMIETSDSSIYYHARKLSIKTLECVSVHTTQHRRGICHEIEFWVNGISHENLDIFCKLLNATQKVTVQHSAIISNACERLQQPAMNVDDEHSFTPFLSTALVSIALDRNLFSDSFVIFVCQVAFITLIHSLQPKALACVVKYAFGESALRDREEFVHEKVEALIKYSEIIISEDGILSSKVSDLLSTIFHKESIFTKVSRYLIDDKAEKKEKKALNEIQSEIESTPQIKASLVLRQCQHHYQVNAIHNIDEQKVVQIVCVLFPILSKEEECFTIIDTFLDIIQPLSKIAILISILSSRKAKKIEEESNESKKLSLSYSDFIEKHLSDCLTYLSPNEGSSPHSMRILGCITAALPIAQSANISDLLQVILDHCVLQCSTKQSNRKVMVNVMKMLLENTQSLCREILQGLNLQSLFQFWKELIREEYGDFVDQTSVTQYLETMMGEAILHYENYGIASASLIHQIQDELIDTNDFFLNTTKYDAEETSIQKFRLLTALISYDVSKYYCFVDKCIEAAEDFHSHFDDLVSETILQGHTQNSLEQIPHTILKFAINRLLHKMKDARVETFSSIIFAMEIATKTENMSMSMLSKILKKAPVFLQIVRKSRKDGILSTKEMEFLNFMLFAASSKTLREGRSIVVKLALVHISSSLLKVLKSHDNSLQHITKFLSIAIELIKLSDRDMLLSVGPAPLKKMIIACLKFGIEPSRDIKHCLMLVRRLLAIGMSMEGFFRPHQIFAMTASHSNFSAVASSRESQARPELIALLIFCVALDKSNIQNMDWNCISALLIGFNANLSKEDYLLRRFIYLHEFVDFENKSLYIQSNFVWGQSQNNLHSKIFDQNMTVGLDNGENWEPFVESLDIKRVRQTITDFPIWDMAKPQKVAEIETCNSHQMVLNSTVKVDLGSNTETYPDDDRYSPAFIMPLLLGVLESFSLRSCMDEGENKDEPPILEPFDEGDDDRSLLERDEDYNFGSVQFQDYRESFVKIVYRLSQKGAISLSLACLSSKCQDIRKMAVSTLYFCLQAIKMKESHNIAQWRERPQLEMILSSVQRGLVMVKSKTMQKDQDSDISTSSLDEVPMLPSVSAIFLARSVLIISKPGDSMFSAINKYFLRIENNHGAYNDCFSLPAFMILFCSANDDDAQSRRERLWALQLLKDGIVDEYSYKVVSRRHVPGLLLSSFDGFSSHRSSSDGKTKFKGEYSTECSIIIEVIQKCLKCGGSTAYNHFVNVIGIFPWIESMLESKEASKVLNNSFFEMILSALEATERHQSTKNTCHTDEPLPYDALHLLNSVICAFETIELQHEIANHPSQSSSLQVTVCNIMKNIQLLHKKNAATTENVYGMFQIHCNGVPIMAASAMAGKTIHYPVLHSKIIETLSYFPMQIDSTRPEDRSSMISFCKSSLSFILSRNISEELLKEGLSRDALFEIYACIIKRIGLVVIMFNDILLADGVEALEMLFLCKRKMLHAGLYELWKETVLKVLPDSKSEMTSDLIKNGEGKKLVSIISLIDREKEVDN